MNISKNAFILIGVTFLVGACTPFYPQPHPNTPPPTQNPGQQTLTDEQQRLLAESQAATNGQEQVGPDGTVLTPSNPTTTPTTSGTVPAPAPTGKNYPTASPVPGKPGFVFNPYTHNIVDVKGIASGKLCRDPEDADQTHKFRVP
jgi:hypothetical protein